MTVIFGQNPFYQIKFKRVLADFLSLPAKVAGDLISQFLRRNFGVLKSVSEFGLKLVCPVCTPLQSQCA